MGLPLTDPDAGREGGRPGHSHVRRSMARAPWHAGVSAVFAAISLALFGGDWLGLWRISTIDAPTPPMHTVGLLLVVFSTFFMRPFHPSRASVALALAGAALVLAKFALTLLGMVAMTPSVANPFMVVLFAIAVVLFNMGRVTTAQIVAVMGGVMPLTTLIGYAYETPGTAGIAPYLPLQVAGVLCCAAILARTAYRGPLRHLFAPDPAGHLARTRIVLSCGAALVLGFIATRLSVDPVIVPIIVTAMVGITVVVAFDIASYVSLAGGARPQVRRRVDRELLADIDGAIANRDFTLAYQPQIDLESGRIVGVEALVRWRHAGRGAVPPAEFIPAAETSGRIIAIGEWVLRQACTCGAAWHGGPLAGATIAVNVSPLQLQTPGFADYVRLVLEATGLPPRRLELELTESTLLRRGEPGFQTLWDLDALGVTIAIDDFGTGYSCLAYLRDLPVDCLKIDQSFVRALPGNEGAEMIARTIVGMGHGLRLLVVAEGVETVEQASFLRGAGCDKGQGYLFAHPLSEGDLLTFAEGWCRQPWPAPPQRLHDRSVS